ncbi:MAG: PEGA domain-containing protein [Magnetococcales bacterium]|nr:PEGA domain-containing protein [Magnetococcales bacterium]
MRRGGPNNGWCGLGVWFFFLVFLQINLVDSLAADDGASGSLSIKVIPRGAEVLINNEVVGHAPLMLENLRPGPVQIRARFPGYRSWGKSVTIVAHEKNQVSLILSRALRGRVSETGTLEVRSEPSGAQWMLDGVPSGHTPARVEGVAVGSHKVGVVLPGFGKKEMEITIIGDETHQVMLRLSTEGARFWMDTVPEGATVEFEEQGLIYKPGMYLGLGRYQLTISHPGYETASISVDVKTKEWSGRVRLIPLPSP